MFASRSLDVALLILEMSDPTEVVFCRATDSLVHFNAQVIEDVARQKTTSVGSDISRISSATSKLREANMAAMKASLIER